MMATRAIVLACACWVGACGFGSLDGLNDGLGNADAGPDARVRDGGSPGADQSVAPDASGEEPGDDAQAEVISDVPDDASDAGDAIVAPTSDGAPDGESKPDGAATADGGSDAGDASDGRVQPHGVPAIFYVPHADDDFLAMALGIQEHIAAGRPVKVILYTNGGNSGLRDILNGHDAYGGPVACPLHGSTDPAFANHPEFHAFNVTDQDIKNIRTGEFERAMAALGVTDYEETGWEDDAVTGKDGDPFTAKLKALILKNEIAYPGTSHKCVSGIQDCQGNGGQPFPTHIACWYAAKQLVAEYPKGVATYLTYWDFRFYDDYIYFSADQGTWNKWMSYELTRFMPLKRAAFDAYHLWDPANGKYALGYHSVPMLFDRAKDDINVHLESLENAPAGFKCPNE
jgi:LmbE family N-acetylglucosaminyl deacetylase